MRKLVSLGLFALMFSMFSSQVFAGTIAACEEIKGDPAYQGLYGLCNAYWNAKNDNARDKILANFEKKAGTDDGGPGMPGLEPEMVACPCWDEDDLLDATCNHVLTGPGIGFDGGLIQFFNFPTACVYSNFLTGVVTGRPTDSEESATCAAGIDALVNNSLLDFCPWP